MRCPYEILCSSVLSLPCRASQLPRSNKSCIKQIPQARGDESVNGACETFRPFSFDRSEDRERSGSSTFSICLCMYSPQIFSSFCRSFSFSVHRKWILVIPQSFFLHPLSRPSQVGGKINGARLIYPRMWKLQFLSLLNHEREKSLLSLLNDSESLYVR